LSDLDITMESLRKAMDEIATTYVPGDRLESYLFRWYISANSSGRCNLRPAEGQVCQNPAYAKVAGRHIDPSECLHLAQALFCLCEEHAQFALTPAPWVCSQCGAPAMFSEPVTV
jgi:hypothetical protein